jgi:DNA-binding transcriptional MerR regulator
MDKDVDAFRTISEVAEDLDLPQHVLRFWEMRFPQIKPMKRSGGRRYYRPEDVDLLRGVKRLLYGEGYTIKGVQRILKEQGARAVSGMGRTGGAYSAEPASDQVPAAPPEAGSIVEEEAEWSAPDPFDSRQARILRAALDEIDECVRLLAVVGHET